MFNPAMAIIEPETTIYNIARELRPGIAD